MQIVRESGRRLAQLPYTHTAKDEYYDDIMRQARELHDDPSQLAQETFAVDLPPNVSKAINALEGDWRDQPSRKPKTESKKASDDKLPPGTIHGYARGQHRANGNREPLNRPSAAALSQP